MAMVSGCCSTSAKAPCNQASSATLNPRRHGDTDSCCDDACSTASEHLDLPKPTVSNCDDTVKANYKPCLTASDSCRDLCCGEPSGQLQDNVSCVDKSPRVNECCTHRPAKLSCDEDCFSGSVSSPLINAPVPSCCDGRPTPCCDQSCLDRIALRECEASERPPVPHGRNNHPS